MLMAGTMVTSGIDWCKVGNQHRTRTFLTVQTGLAQAPFFQRGEPNPPSIKMEENFGSGKCSKLSFLGVHKNIFMSNTNKQVADMQSAKGVTAAESDEYQRRWSNERWAIAEKDGNYDRSREHLNFEVAKGGIVTSIDKTIRVPQRIEARLAQCGIVNPNKKKKVPNIRICAKFIFGGSRERMHELAYGNQKVDLHKGADNSHIIRSCEIEEWAKDIYSFVCKSWGEDNIVGFYVHLDEMNPHIHCTVLPITPEGKLSYKKVFSGDTKWDYRDKMLAIHTELAEVNRKWNLVRGTSIIETGVQHVSTEEYRRSLREECTTLDEQIKNQRKILYSLNGDIWKAQIRLKGLSTMVKNLEKQKADLEDKKVTLEHQMEQGKISADKAESILKDLNIDLVEVISKIGDKEAKLANAEQQLLSLQKELEETKEYESALRKEGNKAVANLEEQVKMRLLSASFPDILQDFKNIFSMLTFREIDLFEDSLLKDLAEHGEEIMKCAMLLFAGYVDQATMVAEGSVGGGGESDLKWGRDEDERAWARRCMLMAHKMVKLSGTGKRNKR